MGGGVECSEGNKYPVLVNTDARRELNALVYEVEGVCDLYDPAFFIILNKAMCVASSHKWWFGDVCKPNKLCSNCLVDNRKHCSVI